MGSILDPLNNWGTKRKITDTSASLTIAEVNARLVLMLGRNGEQTIEIPNSTRLSANVRVLAVVDDENVSETNTITLTDGVNSFSLAAPDEALELMWTGSYWRQLAHSSGSVVSWSLITGKPSTIAGYGITDAVAESRQIISGNGLTGGGNLSADVTLHVGAADSTVTVESNGIRVATGGITNTQIASGAAIAVTKLALGAANTVLWSNGSANSFTGAPTVTSLAASSFLAAGSSPAQSGELRLPAVTTIQIRSRDEGVDVPIVKSETDGDLFFGPSHRLNVAGTGNTWFRTAYGDVYLAAGPGSAHVYLGGATRWTFSTTSLNCAGSSAAFQVAGTTRLTLAASTATFNFGSSDVVVGDGYVSLAASTVADGQLRMAHSSNAVAMSTRFASASLDSRILSFYGDGAVNNRRLRIGDQGVTSSTQAWESVQVCASASVVLSTSTASYGTPGFTGLAATDLGVTVNDNTNILTLTGSRLATDATELYVGPTGGYVKVGASYIDDADRFMISGTTRLSLSGTTATFNFGSNDVSVGDGYVNAETSLALKVGGTTKLSVGSSLVSLGAPLAMSTGSDLTISSDAITVSAGYHVVDTEGGAASDNLATINGGSNGQIVTIKPAVNARDVVLLVTGNIVFPGTTLTLGSSSNTATLMYVSALLKWYVIGTTGTIA